MTDATANARPAPRQTLRAALWMMGAILSFSAMAVGGRELAAELATWEIMAYRSAFGLVVIMAILLWREGRLNVATSQPREHAARNIVHFASQNAWFYAVAAIPLAQLVAIEFTNPVWVALLAPLMLGERLTRARVAALALGFIGVLIVTRPGLAPLELGHGAALFAAVGFAVTNIFTKRLSRQEAALTILFWMSLSQMVMGFAIALPLGLTLFSWTLAPWMLLVGICGLTAHFALTSALMLIPASAVAPMEFARLPVIAVAGALLYGEPLEVAVFVGAAVILAANMINFRARS